MSKSFTIVLILSLLIPLSSVIYTEAAISPRWQAKVDAPLLQISPEPLEFILFLSRQADLSGAARLATKQEKGKYVFQQLTAIADRTQGSVLSALKKSGAEYRSYWIANMIWVRGDAALLEQFARRSDIAHIYANPSVKLDRVEPSFPPDDAPAIIETADTILWNLIKVGADQVWAAGYTGQGITIGGQDTGYAWQHPALINQYRGWNGVIADHNYHWHDAIHTNADPSNPCGVDSKVPCDDDKHGTHTMGTMVGDDGLDHQIGMAPGARWIGCRNMDDGAGTPITYSECYQWFVAPTNLDNLNPNPALAPDVINNSWSCPTSEGCTDPNVLLTVVQNVRAAGIVTVHSAGNGGPNCSTINAPGGIYDESFTVGNTDSNDVINFSSSRGPVLVDGSNRMKPDISAPGTGILSSVPGGGYITLSGTSMAAPHVAGLVALLLSARPSLAGQPEQIEGLITRSAVPRTKSNEDCGGISGMSIPNNTYGWGRIDAWKTIDIALSLKFFYIPLVVKQP